MTGIDKLTGVWYILSMSLRTIFLIVLLSIFTGGLVYLAVIPEKPKTIVTRKLPATPTLSPQQATLMLQYDQQTSSIAATKRKPLDVIIDTNGQPITGAQIELAYDPKTLINVRILPGTFFNSASTDATLDIIDTKLGRISYVLTEPTNKTVKGIGTVASITYDLAPLALVSSQSATTITFTSKTNVLSSNTSSSVLKEAKEFQLIFKDSLR